MSKNLRALLRVQAIMAWRGFRFNLGGGRSKWGLVLLPFLAFAMVPLVSMMWILYTGFYLVGRQTGQGHVVLVMALTAGQLACLMFGIFYVISSFYFSRDLHLLIPMPIRPGEIILAKFIAILAGEYLTMAPLVLPAFLVYGMFAKVSWAYIPVGLVIYLLLPVLPLVLASLFSLVLMRVTNLRRHRDAWRVVGAVFGIGLALGFQSFSRIAAQMSGRTNLAPGQADEFFRSQQSLVQSISHYFPTSVWAANALREGAPAFGVLPLLLFVAVAVGAMLVLTGVAEKIFFGGLVGGEEVRASGRVLTSNELARQVGRTRSPLWALFQREFRVLNRTPTFLMAAVMPVIMMPVFVAIPLLEQKKGLVKLLTQVEGMASSPLIPVIAVGILFFMNLMSNLAATSVSREGRYLWISRVLPVAPRLHVQAKVLHSLLFTLLNVVVVLIALGFVHLLTFITFFYVMVGGLLINIATASSGLIIDLLRPNLKWTDPQQAMKGNVNVIFNMVATLLFGGVYALATVLLYVFARPALLPVLLILSGLAAYGLYRAAQAVADRRYLEYED